MKSRNSGCLLPEAAFYEPAIEEGLGIIPACLLKCLAQFEEPTLLLELVQMRDVTGGQ